jgi:hypothetical protein
MKDFNTKNKKNFKEIAIIFLKVFPLQEIDDLEVREICSRFKIGLISLDYAIDSLEEHLEYLHNWKINNKAYNFFYGRHR